jgi:pimeloyl-ACP methyl ester carboxylesterase
MECAVLVHGFANTDKNLEYLAKGIKKKSLDTITPRLHTTTCSVTACTDELRDQICPGIDNYEKVHFVGYSMGGLIIRKYLQNFIPQNMGRCVFIATPHLGSEVANMASAMPMFIKSLKSIKDLKKSKNNKYLLHNIEIGLIIGTKPTASGMFFPNLNDGLVAIDSALSADAKEVRYLRYTHREICHRLKTVNLVKSFIENGTFDKCTDEQYPAHDENMDTNLVAEGLRLLSLGSRFPSMPNMPAKTMRGEVFWNELANVNGWRVQQNMIFKNCRILRPDNVRVAWGGYTAIMEALERLVKK